MGDVCRATDIQTGELVAVKALNSGVVARDPDLLERFVREGQTLRQLNHSTPTSCAYGGRPRARAALLGPGVCGRGLVGGFASGAAAGIASHRGW